MLPLQMPMRSRKRAANVLATFWDIVFTEFNVAKHVAREHEGQDIAAAVGVRAKLGKEKEREVNT